MSKEQEQHETPLVRQNSQARTAKSNWGTIHSRITRSSLMEAPITARYIFFMFISQTDGTGFVQGTVPGLAREFHVPTEEFRECVEILESPDPDSGSLEHEGRRLKKVQGGWVVLNYQKYTDLEGYSAWEIHPVMKLEVKSD